MMKCDNELFCMWLSKRIHVQMGHLHDCKNYPQKVNHRMLMMDPDQVKRFEDLMACVSTSKEPDMRSPTCMRTEPASPACVVTGGIPMLPQGQQVHPRHCLQDNFVRNDFVRGPFICFYRHFPGEPRGCLTFSTLFSFNI